MSATDVIFGAVLGIAILGGILGVGFFAGYRGTWKHTLAAVGSIAGIFLLPQLIHLIWQGSAMPGLNKTLGGILVMVALIIFGSLAGALISRKASLKEVLVSHVGIASGTCLILEILSRLRHR